MPVRRLQKNGFLIFLLFILFSVAHVYYFGIYGGTIVFKDIYFNFVATSITLFLIIWCLAKGKLKTKMALNVKKTDIAILIFAIYFIVQNCLSKIGYPDKFWSFLMVLVSYYLLKIIFSSPEYAFLKKSLLIILFASGLIQCLLGILQLLNLVRSLNPYFKLTGSFDNPGPYGIYLVSILPFSLCVTLFLKPTTQTDKLIKHLSTSYFITASIIIAFTDSRTAWISFLSSLLVIFICHKKFRNYGSRMVHSWLAKSILIVVLLFAFALAYEHKKDSAEGRLFVWALCKRLIAEKPIFGHGFDSFSRVYMNTQADYFVSHSDRTDQVKLADKINFSFNDYIQISVELGVAGLILFFMIIFSLDVGGILVLIEEAGFEQVILIGSASSLLAILVSCCTAYPLECLPILLNLFLFIAIISGQSKNVVSLYLSKGSITSIGLSTVLILGAYFLIWQCKLFKSKRDNFTAEILLEKRDYEGAIKIFRSTGDLLYSDKYAMGAYAKSLSLANKYQESNKVLKLVLQKESDPFLFTTYGDNYKSLKDYDSAEKCYTHAIFMIPNRLYPRYLLAKLYFEKGETTRAFIIANEILQMKEKVTSMDTWYIKEELKDLLKQAEKAH